MTPIDESFYRLAVAQRDAAWREVEMWRRRYDELVKVLSDRESLQRPPMFLADKESYEAGRTKGLAEGAAAEREACAQVCEAIAADNQRTHAEFEWPVTIPKGCAAAIRARGDA